MSAVQVTVYKTIKLAHASWQNRTLVAECIAEMQNAVDIPVTVKHRIGIDDMHSYEEMLHFVDTVAKTGCNNFIVHARIALLQGFLLKKTVKFRHYVMKMSIV